MEGKYPIKPYTEPKKTGVMSTKITGKMGKVIEVVYKEDNPELITFYLKSNRGTLKDIIEFPVDQILHLAGITTIWNKRLSKEE